MTSCPCRAAFRAWRGCTPSRSSGRCCSTRVTVPEYRVRIEKVTLDEHDASSWRDSTLDLKEVAINMNYLASQGVEYFTFRNYLDLKMVDRNTYKRYVMSLATFAVNCRLTAYIKEVLTDFEYGLFLNRDSLLKLLEHSIRARRLGIMKLIIAHSDNYHLDLMSGCTDPLVFVYKVS